VKGGEQSRVREARGSGYRVERVGRGGEEGLAGERTGLDWLPRLPRRWKLARNGHLFFQRRQTGYPDLPILSVSLHSGVELRDMDGDGRKQQMSDRSGYQRSKSGDIVYNMMRMWQGAVGVTPADGLVSPAYVVAVPRPEVNPFFFAHLFRTPAYKRESAKYSRGIVDDRNRLYWEDFKQMPVVLPPRPEQDAIVAYLDRKLEAVDRYLRVKEREIALLEERKRALIHRAVTRGLDPDPKLKPSGIPWLPEIPVGWDCMKFRRIIRAIEQGWSPVASNDDASEDRWAVITLSAIKRGKFIDTEHKTLPKNLSPAPRLQIQASDFLISRGNTRELVGDVCIVEDTRPRLILNDLTYRITFEDKRIDRTFIAFLLLSSFGREQIQNDARGSNETMVKVSQGHIKGWDILIPPLTEQNEIVNLVTEETDSITTTITRARLQIDRMQEYRTALIAEAVTGKLGISPGK